MELTDAVIDACNEKQNFQFLYEHDLPLRERIERLAKYVYGAEGVEYSLDAEKKIKKIEHDEEFSKLSTCVVKTHLSLSDHPEFKGVPQGWKLHVRDLLLYNGAGFLVVVAGNISLMPGTSSDPAFRRIDVDVETGKVKGLY